jgi:hypothetical protein
MTPTYNPIVTTAINPTQDFADTPTVKTSNETPVHKSNAPQASSSPPRQKTLQPLNSSQPTTRIPSIAPSSSPSLTPSTKTLFNNFDQGDIKTSVPSPSHFSKNNSASAATDASQTTESTLKAQNGNLFLPAPLIALFSTLLALTAIGGAGLIIKEINR